MVLLLQFAGRDHHPPDGLHTSFGNGYWPWLLVFTWDYNRVSGHTPPPYIVSFAAGRDRRAYHC
jgi:hypothetical protein